VCLGVGEGAALGRQKRVKIGHRFSSKRKEIKPASMEPPARGLRTKGAAGRVEGLGWNPPLATNMQSKGS